MFKDIRAQLYCFTVAWSPSNEKQLATGTDDNKVRIWNTDTSECRELVGHEDSVISIAYSQDGITLVSASADHTCRLWNVANGTELRIFRGATAGVFSIVFSPNDGTVFASVGNDSTIRIWHACTGSCIREIIGTSIAEDTRLDFNMLAYSPDGTILACDMYNSNNGVWRIGLLHVNTTECVRTIDIVPDVEPYFVAFRPPIPTEATSLSS
uniref:Anaphase-promoting complex subunit 4 WD40 domain-containing protein n=1 Tax=Aureoumbra lagunensis TaxID=44058 RepID=A0A7S3NJX1_9STRA